MIGAPSRRDQTEQADICLIVEGCYPYVAGGVANWLDWLIRSLPDRRFAVVAVIADERPMKSHYQLPQNVVSFMDLPLSRRLRKPSAFNEPHLHARSFCDLLCGVIQEGDLDAFDQLCRVVNPPGRRSGLFALGGNAVSFDTLMSSRFGWDVMVYAYERLAPNASFPDFFWAWRTLIGGLYSVLTTSMPSASVYHTISTGYAGLFAARAAVTTGRRAAITEHGIYTNERRIDLTLANWIPDSIGFSLGRMDDRIDIRQFWIQTFEAYAKLCYRACTRITTLYGENQSFQLALGAPKEKLDVIPNGIHIGRFAGFEKAGDYPPTVALIGRVVPIKDIKTYIAAVARLKARIPDLRALLLGPTDEDPDYFQQCLQMVRDLGLEQTMVFTGKVNIVDYLPQIDVMVLTSISEAQPLVLLEAGAASIPCVTTDVGSCREIIQGLPDEYPKLGSAGYVVRLMDPEGIADAVLNLMNDPDLRRTCGERLRQRVNRYFTSEASAARYSALYRDLEAV